MGPAVCTQRKTVSKVCCFVLFKKGRREIDDQAPIGLSAVDDRAMYFTCRDKYNVAGLQVIRYTFNIIAYTSVFKIQQFVEIVIMALEITFFRSGQIENTEIFGQISCFLFL